ncbi:MAG TPA: DUF177 domain-containing protein [Longimicrobiaceae bacterium]|nr:DUF177 domain-containing protein [Longimicrobiaceae bacterium]
MKLSLAALDRGEARVQERVPPGDPMFEGMAAELAAPLDVDLAARSVGDGVFVRGTLRTTVRLACRRCLSPVERPVDETVDFLYLERVEGDLDGEVYVLPERGDELDLSAAVREHLLLDVPEYGLCSEECRGLCPGCGANLNEGACDCVPPPAPGAWDALKTIKFD